MCNLFLNYVSCKKIVIAEIYFFKNICWKKKIIKKKKQFLSSYARIIGKKLLRFIKMIILISSIYWLISSIVDFKSLENPQVKAIVIVLEYSRIFDIGRLYCLWNTIDTNCLRVRIGDHGQGFWPRGSFD